MAYRFKTAFVNTSAIVDYNGLMKEVTATNLTPADAVQLIAQGQGQLIEACSDADAATATATDVPVLDTATTALPAGNLPNDSLGHEVAEEQVDSAELTDQNYLAATYVPPIL